MDDKPNFWDRSLSADDGAADAERDWSRTFVTSGRFASSADVEAAEEAMVAAHEAADYDNDLFSWPIPFLNEDGTVDPPSKKEAADLQEIFGVSVDEYLKLYGGPHEQA